MRGLAGMLAVMFGAALAVSGCRREAPGPVTTGGVPGERLGAVRTTTFEAGPPRPRPVMANPYEGDRNALAEGRRLYMWYNCAGCHGQLGGGGIGPPLRDRDWIYGSEPNNLFQSIVQGRPNGMPSYDQLPDDHVWKVVLYVRNLGGADPIRPGRDAPLGVGSGSFEEMGGPRR